MRNVLKFIAIFFLIPSLAFASAGRTYSGTAQYLSKTGSLVTGSTNRTVCFWYKTTSTSVQDGVSWGNADAAGTEWRNTVESTLLGVRVNSGSRTFTATNAADGNKHYACYVLNGTNVSNTSAYLDLTSLSVSATSAAALNTSSANSSIGRRSFDGTSLFTGDISHVQVWNTNLSVVLMAQSYFLPESVPLNRVAYIPSMGDSTEIDLSGNGNIFTVNSATSSSDGPPVMFGSGLPL